MGILRSSENAAANMMRRKGVILPPVDATGFAETVYDALFEVAFIARHVSLPTLGVMLRDVKELTKLDDFTLASHVFKFGRVVVGDEEHEFYLVAPTGIKILHVVVGMHESKFSNESFEEPRWLDVLSEMFELMGRVEDPSNNPTLKALEDIDRGLEQLSARRQNEIRRIGERRPVIKEMITLAKAIRTT